MKTVVTLLLLLLGLRCSLHAESPSKCVVCSEAIKGRFYWIESACLAERQPVCVPCHELEAHCSICRLPVRAKTRKLDDGRLLCDQDAKAGVFSPADAQSVFLEAKRDLMSLLSGIGVLPDKNITVTLVNATELTRLHKSKSPGHEDIALQGLTCTTVRNRKDFEHKIYLLNGLPRARIAAVSAHEYAHTWLHENVAPDRKIESNTIEAFCELVAYKLMDKRHEEIEKKVILANTYTHGQIHALIRAETSHQFTRVIDWMKNGVDDSLFATNTARVLAVTDDAPPELNWGHATPTPVPETLMLKGISGTSARRFALINDRTLAQNEQGRVRVGQTNLFVRCLHITDRSVVIQVKGSVEKTELFLREN